MSSTDETAELLQATLANAVRAPYYARVLGDRWRDVVTLEAFARLPLLDRATAIAHQRELIVGPAPPGLATSTSRLNVLRTAEEHAAIHGTPSPSPHPPDAPATAPPAQPAPHPPPAATPAAPTSDAPGAHPDPALPVEAGGAAASAAAEDGWTLVVFEADRRMPPMRPPDELWVPWSYDATTLATLERVLGEPQPDGRRVTTLRMPAEALKTFALALLERGTPAPASFGLQTIESYGSRLAGRWRDLFGGAFGARTMDRLALSVAPTPAVECRACNTLHFGWPPLIWEVLDIQSGAVVEQGTGRLVVSTLYPWTQKMPFIRYDTGDVVKVGPPCEQTGEATIEFLGAFAGGVVAPELGFALPPAKVLDVLEAMRDTERTSHPALQAGLVKSREIGRPKWRAGVDEDGAPHLRFEARFDPLVFPKTARSIEEHVTNELGGQLRVTACAPGSLGDA